MDSQLASGLAGLTDAAGCSSGAQARLGRLTWLNCGEQVGRGIGFPGRGLGRQRHEHLWALADGIGAIGPLVRAQPLEMTGRSHGDGGQGHSHKH